MPIFAGQNREQLRQMYLDAWHKFAARQPLEPLEAQVAAVIAEQPLRYRNVIEAVKACACVFEATLTGEFAARDPGRVVMSEEEAMAAAERFVDAIMSALDEDVLLAITDDGVFDERYLAKTGSLGHRVLSMLR